MKRKFKVGDVVVIDEWGYIGEITSIDGLLIVVYFRNQPEPFHSLNFLEKHLHYIGKL